MDIDIKEVIGGLKETVIYLGIVCAMRDDSDLEKLMRMGTAINNAITLLEDKNGKEA